MVKGVGGKWGDRHMCTCTCKYTHFLRSECYIVANAKHLCNILFKYPFKLSLPIFQVKKTDIENFDSSVLTIYR